MTDLAVLGLAVDSSQTVAAKTNLNNMAAAAVGAKGAVDGLTNATAGAKTAADGLSTSANKAGQDLATQSAVVNRLVADYAKLTGVQKQINAATGVTGLGGASGAAGIAAYGRALDDLRAKFNPVFAAGQQYKTTLDEINRAAKVGAISEAEHVAAIARTKDAFTQQVNALRGVKKATDDSAASSGFAGHELINLSRQLQDVVVSLQGGQALTTVALQQGSQALDVVANSSATVGGVVKQVTGAVGGFLTAGRLAFGGVTLAIGAAAVALNSYLDTQQKVTLALTGMGRASGLSAANVNSAANAGASLGGLSVSSARDLATAIAATGKVANDNLLPIVKLGHDFATTFGVDDVEAAKMLAQAFADPAKGAEQLNDRLGFLDANMKRQIDSLVAQNRMYEAQKVLLDGLQGSLAKSSEVTSIWSQAWTALKNTTSNFFDFIGEKIANAGGLNASLEKQRDQLKALIANYDELEMGGSIGGGASREQLKKQLEDINALLEKQAQATNKVAAAQASLRQQQTIMTQLPEIAQRQSLSDQAAVAGAVAEDPSAQQALGITQAQANRVRDILDQVKRDYKTTFEEIQTGSKIASDAVTAFSPSAKALIAARQATEQYRAAGGVDPTEKAKIAQDAYNLSLKQTTTALSEAARARALSANQSVVSAQLEIDMVGKTIGQQAELRANLQARQTLEQQASQNRTAFDEAEYARLQKINAEYAKKTQLAAQAAANDNANFSLQTAFLSDVDQQIASVQKQLHGADWQSFMNDGLSATMRIADGMQQIGKTLQDVNRGLFTDFTQAIRNGASAMDALKTAGSNALGKIADKLAQMAADQLWKAAFGGATGGGLFSLLGFSSGGAVGGSTGGTGLSLTGTGGLYADGGYTGSGGKYEPAGIVHRGEYVFDAASTSRIGVGNLERLRGYAGGGLVTPAPMNDNNSGGSGSPSTLNINVNVSGARGNQEIHDMVQQGVASGLSEYRGSKQFPKDVAAARSKAAGLRLK